MELKKLLRNPSPRWLSEGGPAADIVLSSRVRLARNLETHPFPSRLGPDGAEAVLRAVEEAFSHETTGLRFYRLDRCDALVRRVLVEKHLISPQHAQRERGIALVVSEDERLSVMVNEEDHLRIQALTGALRLEEAWRLADRLDDRLERHLNYAFDASLGYLTTCPTNVGTGMRASAMLHLPALARTHQIRSLVAALAKVGVVVRGLYGEGSEALGNLFQVSNQISLGQSEEEITQHLQGVVRQLIERERSAREWLYGESRDELEDRIGRAYGILAHAQAISSEEAMGLLSDLRLGIDLNILPHLDPSIFNELLVQIGPGFLQMTAGRELDARQRDRRRAALIRERLRREVGESGENG